MTPPFDLLAFLAGLWLYSRCCRWLARRKNPTGWVRFTENVGRSLAYEELLP